MRLPSIKTVNTKIMKIYPEQAKINMFHFKLCFDGCSKGNPGLSGAGAVLYESNDEIWSGSAFVSQSATNNMAEYSGLILGLEKASEMKIKNLLVEGDSLLVIKQMKGEYKVNSDNIITLYQKAKVLEKNFENIYYNHIYRSFNKRADELSNIAILDFIEKTS